MPTCLICLRGPLDETTRVHPRCARQLFGAPRLPDLQIELARMHTAALAMVGHTSLSGIQRKISVQLSSERDTLQIAVAGGRFLLKPQTPTYPALPENEHLTTRLAAMVGLTTAVGGLVPLREGTLAYIAQRFDRLPDGRKLRQEDFCQLASKSPKEKYDGTAELCVRIVRQHTAEPAIEVLKLFRLLVFSWWVGNGDMHLKNFSLTVGADGRQRLSPAYDLACTRLVLPEDVLALPVQGKRDGLTRDDWRGLGEYCRLPSRAYERVLDQIVRSCDEACEMIESAPLPEGMRREYAALVRERTAVLAS